MIKLPDLPEGYRWLYRVCGWTQAPQLILQKKGWLFWSEVASRYTSESVWGSEQIALDWASKTILENYKFPTPSDDESEKENNYGIYYGSRKENNVAP